MKNNIIIELKDKVVDDVIQLGYTTKVDLRHVPFNNFRVALVVSTDDMVDSIDESIEKMKENNMLGNIEDSTIQEIVKQMKSTKVHHIYFDVEIVDKTLNFVTDKNDRCSILMKDYIIDMSSSKREDFPIEDVAIHSDIADEAFGHELTYNMSIAIGLLGFFQSEKKTINCSKKLIPIESKKKKKKGSKKNQKRYLYNTKYVFDSTNLNHSKITNANDEKKGYVRHIDQWFTRGHWRTYKSGKKVWIKSRVNKAKDKDDNINNDIQYKITKV